MVKEEKKKKSDGKYEVKHICRNCKVSTTFSIKKGITLKEYMKNKKCKNCGCNITSYIDLSVRKADSS